MYFLPLGVKRDERMALKWFELAAAQGDRTAQFNIGVIHRDGNGVARNDAIAFKWFQLAARQGEMRAQLNLARAHLNGSGVAADPVQAYVWAELAAAAPAGEGRNEAIGYRTQAAAKLSPSALARAKELATLCRQSTFKNCDGASASAPPSTPPVAPTPAPANPTFDDAEAQLRVRQAAAAVSAAAQEVEEGRKSLEAERKRVVQTDSDRDLNRAAIEALEKNVQAAEAKLRAREIVLKEAQEARRLGMGR